MWLTEVVKRELSQNMESGKEKAGSNHSTAQSLSSPFNNLSQKAPEWPFPSYNRNVFRETPWHAVDLYLQEGGMASTSITGLRFQLRLCIKWHCSPMFSHTTDPLNGVLNQNVSLNHLCSFWHTISILMTWVRTFYSYMWILRGTSGSSDMMLLFSSLSRTP